MWEDDLQVLLVWPIDTDVPAATESQGLVSYSEVALKAAQFGCRERRNLWISSKPLWLLPGQSHGDSS